MALTPSLRKKALTSTVESATAVSMFFAVGFNLSGDLLLFFSGVLCAGRQLGVHTIHHFDELLPRVSSIHHVLGLEHNRLTLDGRLQQITNGQMEYFPQLGGEGNLKFLFDL